MTIYETQFSKLTPEITQKIDDMPIAAKALLHEWCLGVFNVTSAFLNQPRCIDTVADFTNELFGSAIERTIDYVIESLEKATPKNEREAEIIAKTTLPHHCENENLTKAGEVLARLIHLVNRKGAKAT